MKKYFLFLTILALTLFSSRTVKAEEIDTCYNNYLISNVESSSTGLYCYYLSSDSWNLCFSNKYVKTIKTLLAVEPGKTYYLKTFNPDFVFLSTSISSYISTYDSEKNIITKYTEFHYNIVYNQLTLTIPENADYSYVSISFSDSYVPDFVYNGTIAFADFDLSICPVIDEPVDPNNPTIQETDQAKILQNFYTLFLDRLKFISEYAINNYLFLSFIGIILIFVILEIFLYLYNRGGYK